MADTLVALGLGSNLNDRLSYLREAIQRLKSPFQSPRIDVIAISPIYESDALLPDSSPTGWNQPFLNLAVLCKTNLSPPQLLSHVKSIEISLGRQHRARWAPREIDIDILIMGPETPVFESDTLQIPHPCLMERPFALLPLADLCPHWRISEQAHWLSSLEKHRVRLPLSEMVAPWRTLPSERVPFRTHRSQFVLTQLVGILNITPDSFSDGGSWIKPDASIRRAHELIAEGASVIDLGAESTRPGAQPVAPDEEWSRLEPVLTSLQSLYDYPSHSPDDSHPSRPVIRISVDTRHAETARRAMEAGASWLNDVTGMHDLEMRKAFLAQSARTPKNLPENIERGHLLGVHSPQVVFMHSLTVPPSQKDVIPQGEDPVLFLSRWASKRIQELCEMGIPHDQMIFDPGIGFGKTTAQSWALLQSMNHFQKLGVKCLVGHSRKSFLSSITQKPSSERDIETVSISLALASQGVDFLRVHAVEAHVRALRAWTQTDGVIRCNTGLIETSFSI